MADVNLLPNGCAVYAAAAGVYLADHGFRCRLITIKLKSDRHIVCLFMINGQLRAYDPCGTRTLPKGLNLDSHPRAIAKAWLTIVIFKRMWPNKVDARWY